MSSTVITTQAPARTSGLVLSKSQAIPWHLWSCITASACIMGGLYWDISWHQTIGRDTFWTPAHLLIQFAAILTAASSSLLIFGTTFGRDQAAKRASVNVLGFRGPLGAFICAWGGAAMLISAPFDNWWHDAYGLDVKIISPPHMVLALGIAGILWGGAILILGEMNRADGRLRQRLEMMLLISGGLLVTLDMILKLHDTSRTVMHTAYPYMVAAIGLPLWLEAIARASGRRWARTTMVAVYTIGFMLLVWIVPLFPGEPKLGPVYQRVTHMLPLYFPLLIIVPAFALDLLWPKIKNLDLGGSGRKYFKIWALPLFFPLLIIFPAIVLDLHWPKMKNLDLGGTGRKYFKIWALPRRLEFEWGKWLQSVLAGIAFVVVLMAVQWPFADFLMSPASRNWMFGTHYLYYGMPPTAHEVRYEFVRFFPLEATTLAFFRNLGLAFVAAIFSTRLGMTWGNWMREVRR